jgi:hypothetical protein
MRSCLVLSNRITYVTVAHIWNKHSQGREVLESDAIRNIIENLACVCFGWPPLVSDSMQKFLDHLEERYVAIPVSSGDRQLHTLTQPRMIECLQKYDPHLRKTFLRAAKGKEGHSHRHSICIRTSRIFAKLCTLVEPWQFCTIISNISQTHPEPQVIAGVWQFRRNPG